MKYLFFAMLLAAKSISLLGQRSNLLLKMEPYPYNHGPNPDVVDTSNIRRLNDKFYIGKATLDRMPVLLPYGVQKSMPNPGRTIRPPENMPNFWTPPATNSVKKSSRGNSYIPYHFPDSAILHKKFNYRKRGAPLPFAPYNKPY